MPGSQIRAALTTDALEAAAGCNDRCSQAVWHQSHGSTAASPCSDAAEVAAAIHTCDFKHTAAARQGLMAWKRIGTAATAQACAISQWSSTSTTAEKCCAGGQKPIHLELTAQSVAAASTEQNSRLQKEEGPPLLCCSDVQSWGDSLLERQKCETFRSELSKPVGQLQVYLSKSQRELECSCFVQ